MECASRYTAGADSCDDDERGRPRGLGCWLCNNIACPAFKVSR